MSGWKRKKSEEEEKARGEQEAGRGDEERPMEGGRLGWRERRKTLRQELLAQLGLHASAPLTSHGLLPEL